MAILLLSAHEQNMRLAASQRILNFLVPVVGLVVAEIRYILVCLEEFLSLSMSSVLAKRKGLDRGSKLFYTSHRWAHMPHMDTHKGIFYDSMLWSTTGIVHYTATTTRTKDVLKAERNAWSVIPWKDTMSCKYRLCYIFIGLFNDAGSSWIK
jgi:hypothetical protein